MTHHEPVQAPFDMDKINAAVDALTPEQRAEALALGAEVAAELKAGKVHWFEIKPEDALNLVLPREGIIGPVNEEGEPCPWPWDPQQLKGAPVGQYHCRYCGAMVLAGVPHIDYTDDSAPADG